MSMSVCGRTQEKVSTMTNGIHCLHKVGHNGDHTLAEDKTRVIKNMNYNVQYFYQIFCEKYIGYHGSAP